MIFKGITLSLFHKLSGINHIYNIKIAPGFIHFAGQGLGLYTGRATSLGSVLNGPGFTWAGFNPQPIFESSLMSIDINELIDLFSVRTSFCLNNFKKKINSN